MDHESMNLWDDPAVVKAYADAAIGLSQRIVKRKHNGDKCIVLTGCFPGGFSALDLLRLDSLFAKRDKVGTKEGK